MLIHREYTNAFPSTFIIYADRLEVKNANRPHSYGQLLPTDFEPFPKNPHIAQIFTQIGRSEELGTGIRKVYKYAKSYAGSANISFMEEDVFVTKVPLDNAFFETSRDGGGINERINDPVNATVNATVDATVSERQKRILIEVNLNKNITIAQLAEKLSVSRDTVLRDMKKLKRLNLIKRVGSDKLGNWDIID